MAWQGLTFSFQDVSQCMAKVHAFGATGAIRVLIWLAEEASNAVIFVKVDINSWWVEEA